MPLRAVACQVTGIALAVAPGEACYIPLGHSAADNGELGLDAAAPAQLKIADAIARMRPALADRSILKLGHNAKFGRKAPGRLSIHLDQYGRGIDGGTLQGFGFTEMHVPCAP